MNGSSDAGGKAPGRVRRALVAIGKAAGLGVVFTFAAAGSVLLHLGLPAPRRFAAAQVNTILATTFKGRVEVLRVGTLHLGRIEGIDAQVFDPEGQRVLVLHSVNAQLEPVSLIRSLFVGDKLIVRIPRLIIGGAEVVLEQNAAGDIGLQRAFDSRTPDTGQPSRGIDVVIPDIHLGHAWVHGHLAAVPVLDADIDDLGGAFTSTPKTTDVQIERLLVHGRGLLGMDLQGAVAGSASLPADPQGPTRAKAHYDGKLGDVPLRAEGGIDGKQVTGFADVPETSPAALATLAPGKIHLGAPVSAHAEVSGELPVLRPVLRAQIGAGEITASGMVTLPEKPRTDLLVSATVNAKDIDVSDLQEGAPKSRLTASVEVAAYSHPGGKVQGVFHLDNQVGEVSGQVVPAAKVRGEFTERSVRGVAEIAERGAPVSVRFSLDPRGDASTPSELAFAVESTVADLDRVERLGAIGHGRVHVAVDGHLDLDTKMVSAKAAAETFGVDVKGVKLASASILGEVHGPLASPRIEANVHGQGLHAGGYGFTHVRVSAGGSPRELDVTARLEGDDHAPTLSVRGHVVPRPDLTVREAGVTLERGDLSSTATIASIHAAGGVVDIRGVKVSGLGDPIEASARISGAGMTVKAKGTDVDLARVAQLLGRDEDARGHLAFDVDATAATRGARGRVEIDIKDLSARGVEGGTVHVATSLEGTRLQAEVNAALGDAGRISISAPSVTLGGSLTEVSTWKRATGTVAVDGSLDLGRILGKLPEDWRPVDAAAGTVTIHGKASRLTLSARPGLDLEATTQGLALVAKRAKHKNADGTLTLGPVPWQTTGVDGTFAVKLDGASGRTEVSAKVHDERGPLASVEAHADLPVAEIARSPGKILALAEDRPLGAKIVIPRRSLDTLPAALGKLPVKGDVELVAAVEGTARAPKVTLTAKGTNLVPRGAAACARPIDVEASVKYDGRAADVRLAAARDGHEVMHTDASVKVNAADALAGGALAWEASGNVAFTSFPLDVAGEFLEQPISGNLNGKVALANLHRAANLEADLDLGGLALEHTTFPSGKVQVTIKDGKISATARLEQADGHLETKATAAMAWGADVAPKLDLAKAVDVAIEAKNFRADAAMPFVRSVFAELDGRIDTNAKLHIEPGGKDGHMDGDVAIRDGSFEVPQVGERFHALQGKVIMKPWGTLRFEDFSAEGPTGKLTAKGDAVIKALALQSANAEIRIADGQSIPITLEGVPMGRAYGTVTTSAKMAADGKRLTVDVDIPMLHVDLPQSTGNSVQPLEPDKTVRIGTHTGKEFVTLPLVEVPKPRPPSDLAIVANVKLGQEIEVKRDTTVDVVLTGQAKIEVTDKTRLTGQIHLVRGRIELQGKQFTIDRGVVSFVGDDPSDPLIVATAYWDAPNATRVFADFSGHVTSGKLVLRSEPSYSQDEILALILFGSTDGSFGAEAPPGQEESTGVKAAGLAGGVVTQGLNKAISGITKADISTRVDTSQADNPQPQVAMQITKTLSARLGYKLGVPAPGDNPDRTELTLDWRFIRNWSLATMVGDAGSTSVDVEWRLRY
jgi:translocation and assembly module TamB